MTTSAKPFELQFIRLDMWWWTAILVLIAAALNWHVIVLTIALLVTWPLVDRFTPTKSKRIQDLTH